MHRTNNAVIMQTEQLGQIEALEEELRSSKVKLIEMEQKMTEQDRVIAQLVGDNLDHLQDNMWLTTHINSSQEQMVRMEHQLGQVGLVVMGFLAGVLIEILMSAGEILMNVNLIFSESVECPKGGSNFSLGVLNTPLGGIGPAY